MTEQRFQDCLNTLLEAVSFGNHDDWDGKPIDLVRSFSDEGVLTYNKGLIVRMEDGTEFQITIVKSRD